MGVIVEPTSQRADEDRSRRAKVQSGASATIDRPALASWRLWLLLVLVAIGGGGCGTVADGRSSTPLDDIRRAVDLAHESGSFRVRGEIGANMPMVAWDGVVVGSDEQYRTRASGLLIESRRIGGRSWGRRLDPVAPWVETAYDGPMDLSVLLRGRPTDRVGHTYDSSSITLQFASADVLRALTHMPSVGPTTARVTLIDGALSEVTLELGGGVRAHVEFGDFGGPINIEPVERSPSAARL